MAKKRAALGRGLNALMGTDDTSQVEAGEESGISTSSTPVGNGDSTPEAQGMPLSGSQVIDIDLVVNNPDQPRLKFDEDELKELADSIEKNGLLQPILVRKVGSRYQIIAGERRWQACKLNGMREVPVRIIEADDIQSIALAMVENIQRSDLNAMEEAYGYHMLMERDGMTQAQVAQTVSKGRSTIANSLRLLDLPEDAQQLLYEGVITAGHARAILSIPDEAGREELTRRLVEKPMNVRDAERLANLISGKAAPKTAREPLPASYKKVAKNLREALGTAVHVKSSKGKNRIEIEFADEDELEQLFKKIVHED